ncbi:hypothetical protein HPT29_024690 [Microvirga terrae]|uniref:Uncharacterized protein n=1 Tax=Microvirga terrae TaxID=2740529 RepID=A0ABY5RRB2_9HYPH|nr:MULTISPECIES: hypothetical protein [Microvirga]MBQ0820481.1 hypothetical protein [Microvirga sp. HBU67558]UVF19573.1 hypothetical protein HPT29_024690 [Microvirga terrae]
MGNAGYGNHTDDTKKDVESKRLDPQGGQQGSTEQSPDGKQPAAGPHSKPSLTNPDSTPGTGALPDVGDHDATDSTSS